MCMLGPPPRGLVPLLRNPDPPLSRHLTGMFFLFWEQLFICILSKNHVNSVNYLKCGKSSLTDFLAHMILFYYNKKILHLSLGIFVSYLFESLISYLDSFFYNYRPKSTSIFFQKNAKSSKSVVYP